jgi:hypothetical protein
MNLSIRHWLAENYIEISQINDFSQEQITGIVLRIIRDIQVRSPLPFDICTLTEVLELPLGVVWQEISVFARMTRSILQLLGQKKPFERSEAAWLAFQVAYLQALEEVLLEEERGCRAWWERMLMIRDEKKLSHALVKPLPDEHLLASLKILRGGKLTDVQAQEALSMVANSSFVQQIHSVAVAWLVANSLAATEAELIIRRLENKLLGHLIVVVSENAAELVQLQKFFKLGNSLELRTTEIHVLSDDKIDCARERYRASLIKKLGEPLLIESFSVKDVYVPSKGLLLKQNYQTVDLMKWVVSQLEDLETITVIESESGYGKTSFCQFFAARVARKFYPDWIPVFIPLNGIKGGETFIETLESALNGNYDINLSTWLENPKHRFLFILDGLNELPHSADNKMAIAIFMQQLFEFQSYKAHKIILTSQSWILDDIASIAPFIFRRIQIQPWAQDEWKQWFANLSKVESMTLAQNLFALLKRNGAFSVKSQFLLSHFVRQPLMLYLLAFLYRNQLLDDETLRLATNPQITNSAVVLWRVFDRIDSWLLNNRVSGHIHHTSKVVTSPFKNSYSQKSLDQIQGVTLQILFSGKKKIDFDSDFSQLSAFYFKSTRKSENSTPRHFAQRREPPHASGSSTVEFSHSKLGEYRCAKAIVAQLKTLTKRDRNAYTEMIFTLDSPSSIAQHLYYLLGYGILTPEIEELVIEGLRRQLIHKFSFELLCDRLESFWYAYCNGRWLDEGIAHQAWSYFKPLQNPVNVEQVNAAVGINVFLLLSACYRETKRTFSPCQNPSDLIKFHPQALIKLLAKTAVFHPDTTRVRIGEKSLTSLNLSKADLTQAMLAGVNFVNTDLSNAQLKDACLVGANLADANLTGADLTSANLTNANLTNANLTNANLTGANLLGVNLDLVNLANACLFQAIIAETQKETALGNGAVFSLDKFEELQRLLSYQSQPYDRDTGEETEIAFKETYPSIGQIESAEGEPNLPLELELDSDMEDETVFGTTPADFKRWGDEGMGG